MTAPRRLLFALAAAAAVLAVSCDGGTPARRPNVLVVVMDTTRADRCSFLGYGRPTTPRLAEFAKDAVTFRDAWAPCCWTGPSHASLFTGLRPERHGYLETMRKRLDDTQTTLAERLRDAGWRTGCFTNNELISAERGLTQGFDVVQPFYLDAERPYPYAAETHRRALAWALSKEGGGKPFFLFVNDMEPHLPYEPPPAVAARFVQGSPPPPELEAARAFNFPWSVGYTLGRTEVSPRKLSLLSDLYDGEIAALDDEIGRLLDGLRGAGVLDDTIVVVCSDHGESLGEHKVIGHLFSMHRSTLHVPLLVRYPGAFDGGSAVDEVVRLEDVAPTLLELCGVAPIDGADGASLTGGLRGRVARGVFGEQTHAMDQIARAFPGADLSIYTTSMRSVFDGRLHLIRHSTGRDELYDVRRDPGEVNDLAPQGGPDLERLRGLLPE
jgi:arylsulfatase A-like enzyme